MTVVVRLQLPEENYDDFDLPVRAKDLFKECFDEGSSFSYEGIGVEVQSVSEVKEIGFKTFDVDTEEEAEEEK